MVAAPSDSPLHSTLVWQAELLLGVLVLELSVTVLELHTQKVLFRCVSVNYHGSYCNYYLVTHMGGNLQKRR